MELKNLLGLPVDQLTTDQLEEKIRTLKKLKIVADKPKVTKTKSTAAPKSNKDKQIANLIKSMSPDQLKALMAKLS